MKQNNLEKQHEQGTLRAVIYFRSNNREQFETENDIQVKGCEEYAERNNIQIVGTYKDQFVSGKTIEGRKGLNQLIEDSSKDLFDVVLVHKIERVSRSTQDFLIFESELYQNGVTLITATTPLEELENLEMVKTLLAIFKQERKTL